ncbi:hypothetical protein SteCoe_13557 [Stentor coeruleus]|uniref:Uncharacterized protein n=1 Tax=Stentor coeruleus TaxID=5963 RepID=A0A1R2C833_9CILI|nr:hypothetical protein SteCoe_13557 [Stentor coeruleus]
MEQLTDFYISTQEELLTPQHSIPSNIHCMNISGSGGHFNDFNNNLITLIPCSVEKSSKESRIPSIQGKLNDANKQTLIKQKLVDTPNTHQPKKDLIFNQNKRMPRAESADILKNSNHNSKILSENLKTIENPKQPICSNYLQNSTNLQSDVVNRLLQYGENIKKKLEANIQKKKDQEEQDLKNLKSFHKRNHSDWGPSTKISMIKIVSPQTKSNKSPPKTISNLPYKKAISSN